MPFHPSPKEELTIKGERYFIAEHPSAPGMPYGQEGRTGIVYRLAASNQSEDQALKVFKPRFRLPHLVSQAEKLSAYAGLPGLQAAQRSVLSPSREADLLRQYPELTYAVLMPWLDGITWLEVLLNKKKPLSVERSLSLARALAEILVHMEERGLAHCDLSGPNVMLPILAGGTGIALIDLEGFFAPGMLQPQSFSSGSAGYSHQKSSGGYWRPEADRFAGAVLLAEMLGWCDNQVCQTSWGESYFEPGEMQQECAHYHSLNSSLRDHWGTGLANLFERAWRSVSLADCPTFGEWLVVLPLSKTQATVDQEQIPEQPAKPPPVTIESVTQQIPDSEAIAPVQEERDGEGRAMMFREVETEVYKLPEKSGNLSSKIVAEAAAPSDFPMEEGLTVGPGKGGEIADTPIASYVEINNFEAETAEKLIIPTRPQPPIQRKRRWPGWVIVLFVLFILASITVGITVIVSPFLTPSSPSLPVPTTTPQVVIPVILPTATQPSIPIVLPTSTPIPSVPQAKTATTIFIPPTQLPTRINSLPCTDSILVGSADQKIYRINTYTGSILETIGLSDVQLGLLTWNPIRNEAYTADYNGDVISIVKPSPLTEIGVIKQNVGWNAYSLAVSPDGQSLFASFSFGSPSGNYRQVAKFDPANKVSLNTARLADTFGEAFLVLSSNGEFLYASWDSNIGIFSTKDLSSIRRATIQNIGSGRLAISADNRYLFVAQSEKLIKWNINSGQIENTISLPGINESSWIEVSRDNQRVWIGGSSYGNVPNMIYEVPVSLTNSKSMKVAGEPFSFIQSSDGQCLYSTSFDNGVAVTNFSTGESRKIATIQGATGVTVLPNVEP